MKTSDKATLNHLLRAREGDLAVIISTPHATPPQEDPHGVVRVSLGRVSRTTRSGVVTRYEEAHTSCSDDGEHLVCPFDHIQIVNKEDVDVEAVLADYRTHTFRATGGADSDVIRAYPTVDEAFGVIQGRQYSPPQ